MSFPIKNGDSPPARWGLLDFMSVACSSSPLLSSPPHLLSFSSSSSSSSSSSNCDPRSTVFSVGPQPRPSMLSVPCRTSTASVHAKCSLPDLNHDHPRPVFPAGPQLGMDTRGWGPAGNTGRGWSWLRSGREHWAWMLVVEVRQGTCRKIWDKVCAEES